MTNIQIIENKISSIKKYLKLLGIYKKYSFEEIRDDVTVNGAVEKSF